MTADDNRHVIAVADPAALAATAAAIRAGQNSANGGRVAICLTGGSSPKQLYPLLATDAYRKPDPWERVHWFIGDERFVPARRSAQQHGHGASRLPGPVRAGGKHRIRFRPRPADLPIPTGAHALQNRNCSRFTARVHARSIRAPVRSRCSWASVPTAIPPRYFRVIPRSAEADALWVVGVPGGPMSSRSSRGSPSRRPPSPPAAKCCSRFQAARSVRS